MTRHTYDIELEIAGQPIPVAITFDYEPGYEGDRVDPPCPAEADIVFANARLNGVEHECPTWLVAGLRENTDLYRELVEHAESERQPDPDSARDARMETRP